MIEHLGFSQGHLAHAGLARPGQRDLRDPRPAHRLPQRAGHEAQLARAAQRAAGHAGHRPQQLDTLRAARPPRSRVVR